jgi:hypothetical protein
MTKPAVHTTVRQKRKKRKRIMSINKTYPSAIQQVSRLVPLSRNYADHSQLSHLIFDFYRESAVSDENPHSNNFISLIMYNN